jgi:nitroreductase
MKTLDKLKWRYATKKFDTSKKLSHHKLNILKQAFNLTATSFGLQTIKLVIVEDIDLRSKLLPHSYNQKQVVDASVLLVICIQEDVIKQDVVAFYDNIKSIRGTSETILKPYRENLVNMFDKMNIEERQQWSKNQAYIALGNLMTVCAMEDLDACPMEGFIPKQYDEILNLEKRGLKSVLALPVGYRAADDMFAEFKKVRQPIEDVVIEI